MKIKRINLNWAKAVVFAGIFLWAGTNLKEIRGEEYHSRQEQVEKEIENEAGDEIEEWVKEEEGITLFSETVYSVGELERPEERIADENGLSYQLKSWEIEEIKEEAREERVEESVIFYGLTGEGQIEDTRRMEYKDEKTGEQTYVQGKKTEVYQLEEWWMEDSRVPLICFLGRNEKDISKEESILYNQESPPEAACREILERMGISEEDYQIEKIAWEGDVFENEDGHMCRMIRTEGKRKVRDYKVVYEGKAVYPETVSYRIQAKYEPDRDAEEKQEETNQENVDYGGDGQGEGRKEGERNEFGNRETQPFVWKKAPERVFRLIRERKEIVIPGVLVLAATAAVWLLLAFLMGKKKK